MSMSVPNRAGRLDLLLHGLAEVFIRQYVQPSIVIDFDLWENGLNGLAAHAIRGLGVPQGQVQVIQLGQLQIPMSVIEGLVKASKVLPQGGQK